MGYTKTTGYTLAGFPGRNKKTGVSFDVGFIRSPQDGAARSGGYSWSAQDAN